MSELVSVLPIARAQPVDYNRSARIAGPDTVSEQEVRKARLHKAVQDFESLFIHQLLKRMRATVPRREKVEFGMETMREITDEQLAIYLARHGGIGLGEMLYRYLQQQESLPQEAPEADERNDGAVPGSVKSGAGVTTLPTEPGFRPVNRPLPVFKAMPETPGTRPNEGAKAGK